MYFDFKIGKNVSRVGPKGLTLAFEKARFQINFKIALIRNVQ